MALPNIHFEQDTMIYNSKNIFGIAFTYHDLTL